MKKIPISNFRKKHGVELFAQVSEAVRKSNCDSHVIKNSFVNIQRLFNSSQRMKSKPSLLVGPLVMILL